VGRRVEHETQARQADKFSKEKMGTKVGRAFFGRPLTQGGSISPSALDVRKLIRQNGGKTGTKGLGNGTWDENQ